MAQNKKELFYTEEDIENAKKAHALVEEAILLLHGIPVNKTTASDLLIDMILKKLETTAIEFYRTFSYMQTESK